MMKIKVNNFFLLIIVLLNSYTIAAQDSRLQYPPILKDSYFGVNIGHINYHFSAGQLKAGNTVQSVRVPHTAVRIILLGHQFNKNISAQISYMRPVSWVEYYNINGNGKKHTVWMNVAGLTVAARLPLGKKVSIFTEGGLGLIMRKGFQINNRPVVSNACYATGLSGSSLQYHINKKWDLQLSSVWSPQNKKEQQPHTFFYAAGFNYYMRSLPKEKIEKVKAAKYHFPKQMIYAGYTTNALGYGVNKFVSHGAIPVFWGGAAKVKHGITLNYQRNIFHSRKVFALDWGIGGAVWRCNKSATNFFTLSVYPIFRFTAFRSKAADIYMEYSVAGPSYISKVVIDDEETGKHFTFQDVMGIGFFAGKKKNINAGIRIAHYSNGNLFPNNNGVMIPLTFSLGYVFE